MAGRRNVVLLTVDSLRADKCGFITGSGGTTPSLDRLAEDGLYYTNAIAPGGSTRDSMTAILTGTYPFERPDETSIGDRLRSHMRARETIAERFREVGYETGAITANPWASRQFGFDTGFDDFEDFLDETIATKYHTDDQIGGIRGGIERMLDWWKGQEMFMSWESYYDQISRWLEQASEPYFLWIFTIDVHMPYIPPSRFRSSFLPSVYAANSWLVGGADQRLERVFRDRLLTAYEDTIRYTDSFIERLYADVDDETLLCVHADHGELFGEHGHWGHGKIFEPVCHVPLVVATGPHQTVEKPVSLRELPTLLTGLAAGNRPQISAPYVTARNNHGMRVVRGQDWRYEWNRGDESVAVRSNGDWGRQIDHPLYDVGRNVSDWTARTDRERTGVVTGVQAASPDLQ